MGNFLVSVIFGLFDENGVLSGYATGVGQIPVENVTIPTELHGPLAGLTISSGFNAQLGELLKTLKEKCKENIKETTPYLNPIPISHSIVRID